MYMMMMTMMDLLSSVIGWLYQQTVTLLWITEWTHHFTRVLLHQRFIPHNLILLLSTTTLLLTAPSVLEPKSTIKRLQQLTLFRMLKQRVDLHEIPYKQVQISMRREGMFLFNAALDVVVTEEAIVLVTEFLVGCEEHFGGAFGEDRFQVVTDGGVFKFEIGDANLLEHLDGKVLAIGNLFLYFSVVGHAAIAVFSVPS